MRRPAATSPSSPGYLACVLAAALPAAAARPQSPTVRVEAVPTGGGVQLYDADDNTLIYDGSGRPMFAFTDPLLEASASMQPQPAGFDILVTFTNPTSEPRRVGALSMGNFRLGRNIQYRDFRFNGRELQADYENFIGQGYVYPNDFYSPVMVARNDRYVVGVSIQYPVLEYQHDVQVVVVGPPASPADPIRGWLIEFHMTGGPPVAPNTPIRIAAEVPPGQSRQYAVSVRVERDSSQWLRTLVPYRQFFRDLYGGVRYQRDARPVYPVQIANESAISPSNPAGFTHPPYRRPDVFGWRPWVTTLAALRGSWPRMMLWAPSGLYDADPSLNYPTQFTSRWLDDPELALATDPEYGLPPLAASGVSFGLWWGHAGWVAQRWNPALADLEIFDSDNPAHVQDAFLQIDLGVAAGATSIGLDSYGYPGLTGWERYRWMQVLQERYPQVKFITETVNSDLIHVLAPTFMTGWAMTTPTDAADLYPVSTPNYLADFVNPGHETWLAYAHHNHRTLGIPVTRELVGADIARFAALGYVPVMYEAINFDTAGTHLAAESWLTSVPPDLRQSPQWNTNFDRSRTNRGPDGRLRIIAGARPDEPAAAPGSGDPESPPPPPWMSPNDYSPPPSNSVGTAPPMLLPVSRRFSSVAEPLEPRPPTDAPSPAARAAPPSLTPASTAPPSTAELLALPGVAREGRGGIVTIYDPRLIKAAIERARRIGAASPTR